MAWNISRLAFELKYSRPAPAARMRLKHNAGLQLHVMSAVRVLCSTRVLIKKGKGFPYSLPSVGSGADLGVQAVSMQVIHPAVGCHYFPPGLQLPYQPQSITATMLVPSYTAWSQGHIGVNNLSKVVTQLLPKCRNWTNDLLIASPTLYPLRHLAIWTVRNSLKIPWLWYVVGLRAIATTCCGLLLLGGVAVLTRTTPSATRSLWRHSDKPCWLRWQQRRLWPTKRRTSWRSFFFVKTRLESRTLDLNVVGIVDVIAVQ